MGGNIYESFAVITIPDIPCCILAVFLCKYVGRRKVASTCFFFAGIFIGTIAIFVENTNYGFRTNIILAISGKVFLNVAYNVMYLWTFELFPTVLRGQGIGITLLLSNVGASTAPFLSDVLQTVDARLSYVFMGVASIVSFVIALCLKETKGKPLREQYNDFFSTNAVVVLENEFVDEYDG